MNTITFDFKKARKELGLTLQEAAELTGIPSTTIWNIEHSVHDTGMKRMNMLRNAYLAALKEREATNG